MAFSKKQIIDMGLLDGLTEKHVTDGSCYLTVGDLFDIRNGNRHDVIVIEPRGMVLCVSKETFTLPPDVLAHTTLRNSLSLQGLLALNVGIVDPGFHAPLSSVLINFGAKRKTLKVGDSFLRITFEKLPEPSELKPIWYTREEYVRTRIAEAREALDSTFLSFDQLAESVTTAVEQKLARRLLGILLTVIAIVGIVSALPFLGNAIHWLWNWSTTQLGCEMR